MRGAGKSRSAVTLYQSDYTLISWGTGIPTDPLYDLFVTLKTLIEDVSLGVVTEYKYLVRYLEDAVTAPDPDADVNELGVFEFIAQDGSTINVSIPAIDPAVLIPTGAGDTAGTTAIASNHGKMFIDVGNAGVVALVQFILTGANGFVPGANRIIGTAAPVAVSLSAAYAVQRPSSRLYLDAGI
jgi:hypothetical protein